MPANPDTTGHRAGCQGQEYVCSCGYDAARLVEIVRLRAELESMTQQCAEWQRLWFKANPPRPHASSDIEDGFIRDNYDD